MEHCPEITEATAVGGHRLHLRFSDGVEGEVDIAQILPFEGVFEAFTTPGFFEQVCVDPCWGTVTWPGNLDLAAEPLYEWVVRADPAKAAAPPSVP